MNTISSMKVPGLTEDKCVTLIGMAGAGKSTVGRAVAERLGWAYVDTDHLIESTYGARLQDVTDIIRQNRAAQNAQKCGFQKAPTFRRVASIPVAVVDIAAAQGLDILNDAEAMRKFLNDPDNRAFRTTLERV